MKPRIICAHLLNDFSGSPKVFKQLLNAWQKEQYEVHLFTNQNKTGFLSKISGISFHKNWYIFSENKLMRLVFYALSQFLLFIKLLFFIKKKDIIYINTVLPFGAALAGMIIGSRVIYHIHESTVNPKTLKWFLFGTVKKCASEIINVSQFVAKSHGITSVKSHLLYNAIDEDFLNNKLQKESNSSPKNVLMICSLKDYKGVKEFVKLAQHFDNYSFQLVLNATQEMLTTYFDSIMPPKNITIFPAQKNVHPFYAWADVILNLSRPDGWIETFGLTIIEGMAYRLPAIIPPIGGIIEVVEEGKTGFMVDSRNTKQLQQTLHELLNNKILYQQLADNCIQRLELFREKAFIEQNISILDQNNPSK